MTRNRLALAAVTGMIAVSLFAAPAAASVYEGEVVLTCTDVTAAGTGAHTLDRDNTGTGSEALQITIVDGAGTLIYELSFENTLGTFDGGMLGTTPYTTAPVVNPITFTLTSLAGNGLEEQIDILEVGVCDEIGWIPDTVGAVDPTLGLWHLRDEMGGEEVFFFGNPGDYPIAGDWDCDGITTPGMYRQGDGFVYLRNTNTQGIGDIRFFFGNPGDIPIAGDFDGDGCDTVSIYRPAEGRFFIINELGANEGGLGAADFDYLFGNPGDKPFIGDFDADGIDTVGLHRESTGFVYFRNTHTQGIADNQFFFGDPGDRLVAGDWNGDLVQSPAVFRPSNTTWYFRYSNTEGVADDQFIWGVDNWLPVAGKFGLTAPIGMAGNRAGSVGGDGTAGTSAGG